MSAPAPSVRHLGRALGDAVCAGERLAFWSAVLLPLVHLPLLALWGLSPETAPVLAALWTGHGVALLAGRGHGADAFDRRAGESADGADGGANPTDPAPDR